MEPAERKVTLRRERAHPQLDGDGEGLGELRFRRLAVARGLCGAGLAREAQRRRLERARLLAPADGKRALRARQRLVRAPAQKVRLAQPDGVGEAGPGVVLHGHLLEELCALGSTAQERVRAAKRRGGKRDEVAETVAPGDVEAPLCPAD